MGESTNRKDKPYVGITIGDINGIGPEVIIKSLIDNRILKQFTPVIYGSGKVISYYKKALGYDQFNYQQVNSVEKVVPKKVNVINVWEETIEIKPGKGTDISGEYAIKSLTSAVSDLKAGKIDALTTAPISKEHVQSSEFNFPGHTEYLTKEAGESKSLMFLVRDALRVGVVTGHIPIQKVSESISQDRTMSMIDIMITTLQKDFGIKKPRIAVLGLNPHAGENGLLGKEEDETIIPAINHMKKGNHIVTGPYPADGFFGQSTYKKFDGILAMYHDQGLIPFKTLAFEEGVNYTAGLSFVRTSPDHGTAFQIAGEGVADETSFRNALYLAKDISKNRVECAN